MKEINRENRIFEEKEENEGFFSRLYNLYYHLLFVYSDAPMKVQTTLTAPKR